MAVVADFDPRPSRPDGNDPRSLSLLSPPPHPRGFEVVISYEGDVIVISPRGAIDSVTSPTLALALSPLLADEGASIVLDLTDVDLLDPDRAWVIAEASGLVTSRGGNLVVRAPSAVIRAVLDAAGLTSLVALRQDKEDGDDPWATGV